MAIDSAEFKTWASDFEKRSAYRGTEANLDLETGKTPIKTTLDSLLNLEGVFSPKILRLNAIYACYQATMAMTQKNSGAERREEINRGLMVLQKAFPALMEVECLLKNHPDTVELVLASMYLGKYKGNDKSLPLIVHNSPKVLLHAVSKLRAVSYVSKRDKEYTVSDIAYECLDGPFLFFNRAENRDRSSGGKMKYAKLVEDGLIFNLIYLFRFFSGAKVVSSNKPFFRGSEFVVQGPMLKLGEPRQDMVAHLFNATFGVLTLERSESGERIRLRLKEKVGDGTVTEPTGLMQSRLKRLIDDGNETQTPEAMRLRLKELIDDGTVKVIKTTSSKSNLLRLNEVITHVPATHSLESMRLCLNEFVDDGTIKLAKRKIKVSDCLEFAGWPSVE